jgi:hypothetical protein
MDDAYVQRAVVEDDFGEGAGKTADGIADTADEVGKMQRIPGCGSSKSTGSETNGSNGLTNVPR